MLSFWVNEDRIIWLGLIISLLIHGFIFAFSGKTFIQHVQYSVQPSAQMVEVSVEEIKIDRHSEGAHSATEESKDTLRSFGATANVRYEDLRSRMTKKINAQQHKEAVHSISGVRVRANPDYFKNPPPEYPELAKQMRQEGFVMLEVDVDREGMPIKVEIQQSSGYHLLDQAAIKAVSRWKFQPGCIGDIPVESRVTVPIRFRLER